MYFDCHVLPFIFFIVSVGEAPRERRRVLTRGFDGRRTFPRRPFPSVLDMHKQVLGQYLTACVTDQHAVATHRLVSGETPLVKHSPRWS